MRVRSRISELCQCMGIINTLSKLQILLFIIRIGNLLISSLYGATETFASWFEMAFKYLVKILFLLRVTLCCSVEYNSYCTQKKRTIKDCRHVRIY